MKKRFVAVWETVESGGSSREHTATIEADDDPKEILRALGKYGLCWELALGVSVYELGKEYDTRELLRLLGFKGEAYEVDKFLKSLEMP